MDRWMEPVPKRGRSLYFANCLGCSWFFVIAAVEKQENKAVHGPGGRGPPCTDPANRVAVRRSVFNDVVFCLGQTVDGKTHQTSVSKNFKHLYWI